MSNSEDRTVHLRRNAERGWIDLILAAPGPDEADQQLGVESEALRRQLDEDMTLHEALEVQRLAEELETLRADLRRTVVLRRSAPLAKDRQPEEGPDAAREEESGREPGPAVLWDRGGSASLSLRSPQQGRAVPQRRPA